MASVTFQTDQVLFTLLTEAACSVYGYQPTLPDGTPNPVTPAQFAQQVIVNFCTDLVKGYKSHQAAEAARQQALDAVTQQIAATPIAISST